MEPVDLAGALSDGPHPTNVPDAEAVRAAAAALTAVTVTGLTVPINPISAGEVDATLLPLAAWLGRQCAGGGRRLLVGVTGAGGAGKSVACEVLAACLRALPGTGGVAVLGVDAFHRPNDYLLAHEVELPTGERATLKTIKGTPPTMDCAALLRTLRSLRDDTDGRQQLPYYDRKAHDPRPNGATVGPETAVVLVEGIHLLHAEGAWAELRSVLHCCIHLDTPSLECRRRLIERKAAPGAGRTVAEATAHYELVDRRNLRAHQLARSSADLVLELQPGSFIVKSAAAGLGDGPRLSLPPPTPAVFVVPGSAEAQERARRIADAACTWQRGAASVASAEGDSCAQQAVADGRCAALALCGTLNGSSWAAVGDGALPPDTLLFVNAIGEEVCALTSDHRRVFGRADVLFTDGEGLAALLCGEGGDSQIDGEASDAALLLLLRRLAGDACPVLGFAASAGCGVLAHGRSWIVRAESSGDAPDYHALHEAIGGAWLCALLQGAEPALALRRALEAALGGDTAVCEEVK